MKASFTLRSANAKTGPIPVTMTERASCPDRCDLKGDGCYAENGHLAIHWNRVADRGIEWSELCDRIAALPEGQLWRHNQAGDLPGDGARIDPDAFGALVRANIGRRGFTYTHYDPAQPDNAFMLRRANELGFTVNLSAGTLAEADRLADLQVGPVVVVVPADQTKPSLTPAGRTVAICPAVTADLTCQQCQVCAEPQRKAIIGFPAHGSRWKRIELRLKGG